MALNVKAALVMCLGFVGGMSWLLQGIAPPPHTERSPLVASAAGRSDLLSGILSRVGDMVTPRDVVIDRTPRFAHPSVFEREAATRAVESIALPPSRDEAYAVAGDEPALPPLVYDDVPPATIGVPALAVAGFAEVELPYEEEVIVPADAGETEVVLAEYTPEAPEPDPVPGVPPAPRRYRVSKGDSLVHICRKNWQTTDERAVGLVIALNPQIAERQDRILVGEELLLPDDRTLAGVLAGETSITEGASVLAAAAETDHARWYTIKPNDSLTSIARRFLNDGRRWREILDLNESLDPDTIFPGVKIKLPPIVRVASV